MKRFVTLPGGLTAEVIDDEAAERCSYVVCASADLETPWTDNVAATCCDCGCAVVHRPHAPKTPPKICLACVLQRAEGGHA